MVSTSSTWLPVNPQLASSDCRSSAETCCNSAHITVDTQSVGQLETSTGGKKMGGTD
jgi:hypothetical protein